MKFLIYYVLAVSLISCTVKKRSYRAGYFVNWSFKEKKILGPLLQKNAEKKESKDSPVMASASQELAFEYSSPKSIVLPSDSCEDLIYFEDGTECFAKEIEITEFDVNYKRCDDPKKKNLKKDQSKILMIKYRDGTIKSFQKESLYKTSSDARVHPKAKMAMAFSLLSVPCLFVSLFAPALVFTYIGCIVFTIIVARKAKREIKLNPVNYKGVAIANVAILISLLFPVALIGAILLYENS